MYRVLASGAAVLLICTFLCAAENPDDIKCEARLTRESMAYHSGERIEVEISYSTTNDGKYVITLWGAAEPTVTPQDGLVDLSKLARGVPSNGIISISAPQAKLTGTPVVETIDLTDWYRFQRPGHYRAVLHIFGVTLYKKASADVQPTPQANDDEDDETNDSIELTSNAIEFDIVPADPVWESMELEEIQAQMDAREPTHDVKRALTRLTKLDTEASVKKELELYLAEGSVHEQEMKNGLLLSGHTAAIIAGLQATLTDWTSMVPESLPDLLATLQTTQKLGPITEVEAAVLHKVDVIDVSNKGSQQVAERQRTYEEFLAQANALLDASIDRRSGAGRAAAVYSRWHTAAQNDRKPEENEEFARLTAEVLAVQDQLTTEQQTAVVHELWPWPSHEPLRLMVESLANKTLGSDDPDKDIVALWCQGWSEACSKAIIERIKRLGGTAPETMLMLIHEDARPELDELLKAKLNDAATNDDALTEFALLAAKAGSANLLPVVRRRLEQTARQALTAENPPCAAEAYLMEYLLRAAPDEGSARIAAELGKEEAQCAPSLLGDLNDLRPSEELEPAALAALNSPNLRVVISSAQLLSRGGAPDGPGEDALWKRLNALWDEWDGRREELASVKEGDTSRAAQIAALEAELAEALLILNSRNGNDSARGTIASRCLSQLCRSKAELVFVQLD